MILGLAPRRQHRTRRLLVFLVLGALLWLFVFAPAQSPPTAAPDLSYGRLHDASSESRVAFATFLSGTPKVIASFVPPVSSVMMPIRILEGDVPLWQPIVALALLVGSAFVTIIVGERLYRRSLLQSGGRVSLKQAWKAAE